MLSEYSSNVVSAKVRAMYGKRISKQDYKNLISCSTVTDVAIYLKNNTAYGDELSDINEREVHRGQLENLIKKKLFHDLETLCRYEITTQSTLAEYTVLTTEIEQIIHSLMYLISGKPSEYIYSLPMFFNKRTKLDLVKLVSIKNYDEFLTALKGSVYAGILAKYKPKNGEQINISEIEKALYDYLYNRFFEAIKKGTPRKVRNELSEIINEYIDYSNFVRIIRLKRYNSDIDSAVLQYGTIKNKYIEQMRKAKNEEELFNIMRATKRGKRLDKFEFNYIDELPTRVLYENCKRRIRFSVYPPTIMLSYIFLLKIEIENLITIIEGVRYAVPKDEIENLLILKNQNREGVV